MFKKRAGFLGTLLLFGDKCQILAHPPPPLIQLTHPMTVKPCPEFP